MPREYAYRRQQAKRRPAPQGFLSLAFSFVLGYLAAYLFDAEHLRQFINKQVVANNPPKPEPAKPAHHHKTAALPPKPKFEFYTLLANEKTKSKTPPPETTPVKPTPAAQVTTRAASTIPSVPKPAPKTKPQAAVVQEGKPLAPLAKAKQNFIVQVAAFNAKKDADQMKATLTLKGYTVSIVPAGQWFRVVLGPYANKSAAQQAQFKVAKNEHLQGMLRVA